MSALLLGLSQSKATIPLSSIPGQGLCQDLETVCSKLAIVKCLGIQIFKGDHNILGFQS